MNAKTLLAEAKHKSGCQCGFCKNKGKIGDWRKKKAEKPEAEKPEAEEPVEEAKAPGEVKLSKGVNLGGPAARTYSKMTSKQAMTPGWKTKAYVKAAGEVAGLNKSGQVQGFKNKSAGETTSGKKLPKTRPGESRAVALVNHLLG